MGEDGGISKSSRVMKIHLADMNVPGGDPDMSVSAAIPGADMAVAGSSMTIPGADIAVPGFLLSDIVPHTRVRIKVVFY